VDVKSTPKRLNPEKKGLFKSGGKKVDSKTPSLGKIKRIREVVRNIHTGDLPVDDPAVLSLAMSMVDLNAVVDFRLALVLTLSTDSSGNLAFSIPVDPSSSGSNFPEYSTITTLFNQVRVRSFQCTFAPVYRSVSNNSQAFVVAGCLDTLGNPTSYTSVVQNADSYLYPWQSWTTAPYVHKIKYNPMPVWANVTTPDPGDNIGCPGCIIGYSTGLPHSVELLNVLVAGVYEFRSRT